MMLQPVFFLSSVHELCKELLIVSCFIHKRPVSENKRKLYHFNAVCSQGSLEGKSCGLRKKQKLSRSRSSQEAETESEDQNAKPSCEIMSLQKFPHLLLVKKHPELSGPLKGVFLEGQFCSFWEYSGCFTLPQSSLMYLIHMHMSKFSNGYKDGDPGGRNAMFTSTETRWVAEKESLADFWNGIW